MIDGMKWFRLLASLLALSIPAAATQQPAQAARLTFDVASIRLSHAETASGMMKALPGGHGYTIQNLPVRLMISLVYKVPVRQIQGGPDWLDSDRYDIEARADGSYSLDDLHLMLEHLLEDRFALKTRREVRDGTVYALTVAPSGHKLEETHQEQDFNIPITFTDNGVAGKRVSLAYFSWWLGQQLQQDHRPVIDRTGLTGFYNFRLVYSPPLPTDVSRENIAPELRDRPSLFDALRDQLGLQLKPTSGPIDYYLIEHVERPSEN